MIMWGTEHWFSCGSATPRPVVSLVIDVCNTQTSILLFDLWPESIIIYVYVQQCNDVSLSNHREPTSGNPMMQSTPESS